MRIAMIGAGYVGLVSGACFADFGHTVVCVDKDAEKIAALKRGEMPIYEPGLDALVAGNVRQGRLTLRRRPRAKPCAAPRRCSSRSARRRGAATAMPTCPMSTPPPREIAAALDGFTVIVTKSTVPVGTGDEVERIMRETDPTAEFDVVSNPEFLREGSAINDFKRPDRIVIGTIRRRARAR